MSMLKGLKKSQSSNKLDKTEKKPTKNSLSNFSDGGSVSGSKHRRGTSTASSTYKGSEDSRSSIAKQGRQGSSTRIDTEGDTSPFKKVSMSKSPSISDVGDKDGDIQRSKTVSKSTSHNDINSIGETRDRTKSGSARPLPKPVGDNKSPTSKPRTSTQLDPKKKAPPKSPKSSESTTANDAANRMTSKPMATPKGKPTTGGLTNNTTVQVKYESLKRKFISLAKEKETEQAIIWKLDNLLITSKLNKKSKQDIHAQKEACKEKLAAIEAEAKSVQAILLNMEVDMEKAKLMRTVGDLESELYSTRKEMNVIAAGKEQLYQEKKELDSELYSSHNQKDDESTIRYALSRQLLTVNAQLAKCQAQMSCHKEEILTVETECLQMEKDKIELIKELEYLREEKEEKIRMELERNKMQKELETLRIENKKLEVYKNFDEKKKEQGTPAQKDVIGDEMMILDGFSDDENTGNNSELEREIAELKESHALEMQVLRAEVEASAQNNETRSFNDAEASELRKDLEKAKSDALSLKSSIGDKEREIESLENSHRIEIENLKRLETQKQESHQTEVENLKAAASSAAVCMSQFNIKLNMKEKEISNLQSQLKDEVEKVSDLETKLELQTVSAETRALPSDELQDELNDTKALIEKKDREIKSLKEQNQIDQKKMEEAKQNELDRIAHDVTMLTNEKAQLDNEINFHKEEIQRQEANLKQTDQKYFKLQQQLSKEQHENELKIQEYEEKITSLNKKMLAAASAKPKADDEAGSERQRQEIIALKRELEKSESAQEEMRETLEEQKSKYKQLRQENEHTNEALMHTIQQKLALASSLERYEIYDLQKPPGKM